MWHELKSVQHKQSVPWAWNWVEICWWQRSILLFKLWRLLVDEKWIEVVPTGLEEQKKNLLLSHSLMAVTRKTSVSLLFPLPLCCSVIMFHFPLLIQTFPLCLPPQAGSSASTARGASRASWPCPVLWAITHWRTSTWSSRIPTSCRLTWTSCSQSSWSWRRMACGIPLATRRRFASSESDWTSHISAPRALSSSPSIVVAPTTSPSWWSSLKARPVSSRWPVCHAQYLYYVWNK